MSSANKMGFKLDGCAEEALEQIEDRQYALPFSTDSRKLFKIGGRVYALMPHRIHPIIIIILSHHR